MIPGRTYSFVMWAGDARGRESARSNTVTVTLPVDTDAAGPARRLRNGYDLVDRRPLRGPAVADDDSHLLHVPRPRERRARARRSSTGERAVTVLRLAAATTYSFTVVAVDPSRNASGAERGR